MQYKRDPKQFLSVYGANAILFVKPSENVNTILYLLKKRNIEHKKVFLFQMNKCMVEELYKEHLAAKQPQKAEAVKRYMTSGFITALLLHIWTESKDPQFELRKYVGYASPHLAEIGTFRRILWELEMFRQRKGMPPKKSLMIMSEIDCRLGLNRPVSEMMAVANGMHVPRTTEELYSEIMLLKYPDWTVDESYENVR